MFNEKISVTKEFTFDMAHALFNYDGPCKNIHGHTYRLQVTVSGYPNQDTGNPKQGMVIDFGDFKNIVKDKIIDKYDHALVLNEITAGKFGERIKGLSEKVYFVPFQPTCENMLLNIKNELSIALDTDNMELQAVRLYETPGSWAEWSRNKNKLTIL